MEYLLLGFDKYRAFIIDGFQLQIHFLSLIFGQQQLILLRLPSLLRPHFFLSFFFYQLNKIINCEEESA